MNNYSIMSQITLTSLLKLYVKTLNKKAFYNINNIINYSINFS